jgi:hypothetical protein
MKNAIFWDVTPCGSCNNNDISEERITTIIRMLRTVLRLLVTANVVPSSPILITLMMVVIVHLKHWFLQESHDATCQKTAFFIVTAVKTSDLILL